MIDLLTKRYNSKKQYSPQSLETFAKLIDLSGLPINARSLKYTPAKKTGGSRPASNIQYYKSPDELVERLHLLLGSKLAGNVSLNIDYGIVAILYRLHKDEIKKRKDYQELYTTYVKNAFSGDTVLTL